MAEEAGLDVIQLSGKEGWENLDFYKPFALINAEHVSPTGSSAEEVLAKVGAENQALLMLDTKHPSMEGGLRPLSLPLALSLLTVACGSVACGGRRCGGVG